MTTSDKRTEAFSLAQRAIRIQVANDHGELSDAESCLVQALDLDPDSIEALQEAAHFYDAVMPNEGKAREYALRCRELAAKLVAEMDEILSEYSN
jgi:Tfp pilus assembly protein PilF